MLSLYILLIVLIVAPVAAWQGFNTKWASQLSQKVKFVSFKVAPVIAGVAVMGQVANADLKPSPWSDKIQYEVVKENPDAAMPKVGDLVAVRFSATYKNSIIDDTFNTADPFYFRLGVGTVVKGMDETVAHMHEGDRVRIQVGGDYAFGSKGLPAAPGRPRIPPNAVIDYDIQLVQVPGYGDDIIADE